MRKLLIIIVFTLLSTPVLFAATISSNQSGAWNNSNTWIGGVVPDASDDVIIQHDVTLDITTIVNSLTFGQAYGGNSGIGTLVVGSNSTFTIATGDTNLNRSGNALTIDEGSSIIKTEGDFLVSAAATVIINGSLDVQDGAYTVSGGNNSNMSVGLNGTLNVSDNFTFGHNNQNINILGNVTVGSMSATSGSGTTFNIESTATFTITGALTIISTQNFDVDGVLNIGSVSVSGGSPDFVINAGGVVNVSGNFDIASAGSIDISNSAGTLNVGGDMNISGGANANVEGTLVIDGNLSIENNGNKITGSGTVTADTADCPNGDCGVGTEEDVTLPVTLSFFELAAVNEFSVRITWQTASEINNDYFELYRSTDGVNFEQITIIEGKGTTNNIQNYEYLDQSILAGTYYYYLKQVDYDGKSETFETQKIAITNSDTVLVEVIAYPSPLNNNSDLFLQAQPQNESSLVVNIYDVVARQGTLLNYQYEGNEIRLQTSDLNLKPGIYMLKISYDLQSFTKRIIIK